VDLHQQRMQTMDVDGQADLFAVDGVMEAPFALPGQHGRLDGREAIRAMLTRGKKRATEAGVQPNAPTWIQVHECTDPEVIIVETEYRLVDVDHTDGFRLPYIQVYHVRDGEIISFRDYYMEYTAHAKLDP